jgi:Zn-dependent peptidase ImmA (M78 family)
VPGRDTNVGAKRARETRAALGLDPAAAVDILEVAEERAGVPVAVAPLPDAIAGCCWRDGPRALLWVNGTQALVRQRFTLAHELGHLRLGHGGEIPPDSVAVLAGETRDPREVQANAFAAELLAPRAGVAGLVSGEPSLEAVAAIAGRYGISMLAALFRLVTLGLTTRAERLRAELEDGLGAWLEVPPMDDGLARVAMPRLPGGSALAAALGGRASVGGAAAVAGVSGASLGAALTLLSPGADGVG